MLYSMAPLKIGLGLALLSSLLWAKHDTHQNHILGEQLVLQPGDGSSGFDKDSYIDDLVNNMTVTDLGKPPNVKVNSQQ